ncbi:hypothetical protein LE190_06010 [Massilia oculi]|uniref:Phosphate starvation-inducible protein PsiF n=1 Tax=Massilia hydrophila TaxID=3044279 RepID=A0ABS7Y713_9BURK|nr:hypothetical protein [Massilia oculi]MCA1855480.1 hypothetical protein [Massilia oculi]
MKSTFKLAGAVLLMASTAAFAAPQAPAPASTHPLAAAHASAPSKAEVKADKQQIRADEKTALANCNTMKGAEKSACKKDAVAKAQHARGHVKASKHS